MPVDTELSDAISRMSTECDLKAEIPMKERINALRIKSEKRTQSFSIKPESTSDPMNKTVIAMTKSADMAPIPVVSPKTNPLCF